MYELRLLCPQDAVDAVSDALVAVDALSVSVEDADAQTDAEQALFGEPGMPPPQSGWQRSLVAALFQTATAARDAARLMEVQDFFHGGRVLGVTALPEQDWVRLTQSQFAPVEISPRFWIVPTWHEPPNRASTVIRLDPGLAFGTGTHPTTRMCLRWIEQTASSGPDLGRVLDYGCGSGILAIGAAKHGAADVWAVDIDPAAVSATQANAEANSVVVQAGLPDCVAGRFNTVLANILATPLKVMAPLLCDKLAPGGALVLAGILERQTAELQACYAPYLQLVVADCQDGWALMTARR